MDKRGESLDGPNAFTQWMRHLTPGPAHRRLGLVCLGVGHQSGALPTVGPRVLEHHVAVVVTAGSGWFSHGGGPPREVTAPALLWLLPGVPHHYAPHRSGWEEWFVDFTGSAVAAYRELGFIPGDDPVVPLTGTDAVVHAISRIARACRTAGPYLEVETSALVPEVLVALRRARADEDPQGEPVLRGLARDAFLPVSVAEHARRLGMPVADLRQVVRRLAGCSPKDYLLTIRLNRAKELLAAGDLPVASIARRVGYDDPAYFTRIFTKRAGLPPSEFRAQWLRG